MSLPEAKILHGSSGNSQFSVILKFSLSSRSAISFVYGCVITPPGGILSMSLSAYVTLYGIAQCCFLCKAFPGPHPVFTSQFLHGLIFIQQLHFNSCALDISYDQNYLQKSLRKMPLGRPLYCLLWNKAASFSRVWQQVTVCLHKIFHLGVKVFQ